MSTWNCHLQQNRDHMCLWPSYYWHHDTAKQGYSGVMKNSTGKWIRNPLSLVLRVDSVCVRVIDVYVYGVEPVTAIFRSAFTHRPHSGLHGVPAISYNLRSHLVFLQRKLASAPTLCRLLIPWYCHIFDRKAMCFLSRTEHFLIRMLWRNVLLVEYTKCSCQQDPYSFSRLATIIAELRQNMQNAWKVYRKVSCGIFVTVFIREYMHALLLDEGILCIYATVWAPLTVIFNLGFKVYHILLKR
jgi:hypothetical protein